jgi:hypothetical protein
MKSKGLLLTIAVLFGLRITATAQTPPAYVPTDGLAGWWPFNGNANDESGNGNNGTVNGATLTEDRFGEGNAAYEFDGMNDISIANDNTLSLNDDFTISLWFNAYQYSAFNTFISKTSCGDINGVGYVSGLQDFTSGGLQPKVHYQSYPYFVDATPCLPGELGTVDINTWIQFVVVYHDNDNSLVYFLNETAIDTLELDFQTQDNSQSLFIGNHYNTSGGFCIDTGFFGDLDDIGIWNRALTQEEVTNLFNASVPSSVSAQPKYSINLYPNPTADVITLEVGKGTLMKGYALVIENALGQKVHEMQITQQTSTINLGSLAGKGLYFVHIFDTQGNAVDVRKVVVD